LVINSSGLILKQTGLKYPLLFPAITALSFASHVSTIFYFISNWAFIGQDKLSAYHGNTLYAAARGDI